MKRLTAASSCGLSFRIAQAMLPPLLTVMSSWITSLSKTFAQSLALSAQLGDPGARLAPGGADDGVLDITRPEPGWAVAMGLSMLPTNL